MRILAVSLLLLIWFILSQLVALPFLPSPVKVAIETVEQTLSGRLPIHFLVSSYRVFSAVGSSLLLALPLGILAGRSQRASRIISPVATVLYPIPKVALLPIILLFFGLGDLSKIILMSLVITFQLFFVIRDAAASIDRKYVDSARSLGATRYDILVHVTIPAVLPSMFTSLRVSSGTAAAILFLSETFASTTGLGWYIMDAWSRLDYLQMYAGITALSLLGILLFSLFALGERSLCPWTGE